MLEAPTPHKKESPLPTKDDAQLSHEEEELFRKRFEEGDDIYTDGRYVQWLKEHHSDALPATEDSNLPDQQVDLGVSVAVHFSTIAPQSPVAVPEPAADVQTHTRTPQLATAASSRGSLASRCVAPNTTTKSSTPTLLPASPLGDLLVHPGTFTPARVEMALPRARLLTSASS